MPEIDPSQCEAEIDQLIEQLSESDPALVETDVYQRISFTLCRKCKEIFVANPLNLPLDPD